jgi:hypothetical protein
LEGGYVCIMWLMMQGRVWRHEKGMQGPWRTNHPPQRVHCFSHELQRMLGKQRNFSKEKF